MNARKRRNTYKERKEQGLCPRCGKCSPPKGKSLCDNCRQSQQVLLKKRRVERIRNGICPNCGARPSLEGQQRCGPCAERRRKTCAARRLKRQLAREEELMREEQREEAIRRLAKEGIFIDVTVVAPDQQPEETPIEMPAKISNVEAAARAALATTLRLKRQKLKQQGVS